MAEAGVNADRRVVLAWALGTFHACVLGLVLLVLLYPTGGLGQLLAGLETLTGLLIFIALWSTSVWTTRHALADGVWLSTSPIDRAVFFGQALRWGAATGTLFLAELGAIFLVRTLIVTPSTLLTLGVWGIAAFGAAIGTIGMLFAFVIGAIVGVTLGGLDLVALSLARRVARDGQAPG